MMLLDKELEEIVHSGCPNRHHCEHDSSKCCYLVKGHCIIGEDDSDEFR
jgi:hypothetical protein